MANWLTQLFGSRNQRLLNGYSKYVSRTNALEATYKALSDEQLQGRTAEFRSRLAAGETVDDLLPDAFAATREAARRVLGHEAFRCAAHRRHVAAFRQDRRNAHR